MSCGHPHKTPCAEVIAALSAYVDGEVEAEEYRLIAVHITECPPCSYEEEAQRTIKALVLRSSTVTVASSALYARIRSQVRSVGEVSEDGGDTP